MILKGNQRSGGQQLAVHLMNSFDNEQVELAEVRGSVAQDLSGAFSEWTADASATNCRKNLYSFSASPDPAQRPLTREEYFELLDRTERSLKLVGQPRAVVFHTKEGRDHMHAVWSRIGLSGLRWNSACAMAASSQKLAGCIFRPSPARLGLYFLKRSSRCALSVAVVTDLSLPSLKRAGCQHRLLTRPRKQQAHQQAPQILCRNCLCLRAAARSAELAKSSLRIR
jgi:hypothetical protein